MLLLMKHIKVGSYIIEYIAHKLCHLNLVGMTHGRQIKNLSFNSVLIMILPLHVCRLFLSQIGLTKLYVYSYLHSWFPW